jgi:hypothetical protein
MALVLITSHSEIFLAADGTSSSTTSSGVVLEEVLEEAPKWKVLRVSE